MNGMTKKDPKKIQFPKEPNFILMAALNLTDSVIQIIDFFSYYYFCFGMF